MSNAATPLPPNTGMTLVADVAGTTLANDAYWADKCKVIPPTALFIVVQMGNVTDFFKPIFRPVDSAPSYCEMLKADNMHQWSVNGVDWEKVGFYGKHKGGSTKWWPRDKGKKGDERGYLSFWGDNYHSGGCCSTSTAVDVTPTLHPDTNLLTDFRQPFTMYYAISLQPPPPNTGLSLVADVAATTLANDQYWAEKCKIIPSNVLFVVVDMGAVRDFFKPINSETSFCEMLQSHNKHQWSVNGIDWVKIEFNHGNKGTDNGGSAHGWPRDKGLEKDKRVHLSFWGLEGGTTGGCCSSSTTMGYTHPRLPGNKKYHNETFWGQSFTLSYGFSWVEANARLLVDNQLLNSTVAALSDNLTTEQYNLATEQAKVAVLTDNLVAEKGQVAAVSQNLTTCNIKLEQRRLARLAQAEENLANDHATIGEANPENNSENDGDSTPSSKGAVAGGVVAGLVVVGIIVFILWRNGVQGNQRNNVEAEELRGRGATLEMMQNPMWEQQRGAAVEGGPAANLEDVADVYYSEIAEVPNQDADGYVVDDSLAEPETPVYATYASSGAPGGAFYAAPADGDGVATYAAPLDTATAAPQPSASPPEVGGVAYSRSANSVVVPGSNTSHA